MDGPDVDDMHDEGICGFLEELGVDLGDVVALILAWKMNAQSELTFTREEFTRGFQSIGVNTIKDLKAKIPELRDEILMEDRFNKFYQFLYKYVYLLFCSRL